MKNRKQKGYVLAFVMILMFALTILLTQTFTILMRREIYAKKHFNNQFSETTTQSSYTPVNTEEDILNGWI